MNFQIRKSRIAIFAGAALALMVGALSLILSGSVAGGCSSREDVTARVAEVSSRLQSEAAQGRMTVEQLAEGIKKLNAAATTYETSHDHQGYCESLEGLQKEILGSQ